MFSGARKKLAGSAGRGGAGMSFIGKDVVVSGNVTTAAQIHVDGRIDGDLRCETLVQGGDGTVTGNIVAESVHLSGLVDGNLVARVVTLDSTARVTGDVTYETLSIAAGGAIEGRLTRRDAPSPAAADRKVEPAAPAPAAAPERKRARAKADPPTLLADLDPPTAPPVAANG